MTAGRIPDAAAVPLLEGEATFTIIGRANAAVTAGTWHLVFIGVVGTATVILFSLASWPLLGTGKAPITGSYVSMVVSNEADGQLPAGPRSTYSPAPEAEKISDAFSPQPTPVSAVSAAGRAKSDLELARQDHDADTGPATAGILMQGVRITNPQSIEQLGSTATAVAERPSIAEGIGTVPDVSLRTVPSEIPDGEGREVSHSVEMQKEPANL